MIDYEKLSDANKYGANAQLATTLQTLWDDIKILKEHKHKQIDENRFVSKALDEIRERLDIIEGFIGIYGIEL